MFCFKSYTIWYSRKGNTSVTPKLTKYLENEWFLCWLCFFDHSRTFSRTDFKISVKNISHSGALKLSLYIWLSYYDFRLSKYLLLINFNKFFFLSLLNNYHNDIFVLWRIFISVLFLYDKTLVKVLSPFSVTSCCGSYEHSLTRYRIFAFLKYFLEIQFP